MGFYLRILTNQFKIPKSFIPISHFRSFNKTLVSYSKPGFILKEIEDLQSLKPLQGRVEEEKEPPFNQREFLEVPLIDSKVQISHPWPEWVKLMELLLKIGYFKGNNGHPFDSIEMGTKDSNRIRTACLNFARDHADLIRNISRKHVQVIVESGCPSIDRKVVNSGKRLRAHIGIEEGNVCSSCSLRGSCERAYVKAREDEIGRTVDVMRILLTYGLDPVTGSVENKPCGNKSIKESVRRLLFEMVEFSIKETNDERLKFTASKRSSPMLEHRKAQIDVPLKQGDWICPKCNFLNFAKNIKCLRCDGLFQERLRKLKDDQDHLPLKKGDWICEICNSLNFANNTRCFKCKEKPTNRQLNPGEWECESCNYINFKRNEVCLKCDWKRPKASNHSHTSIQPQQEGGDFRRYPGMKFVRDDNEANSWSSVGQERQSQNEGANLWRCIDEKCEDADSSSPGKRFLDLEDFPIVGGKSAISQNPQEREKWKEKMSKHSRGISRQEQKDDALGSTNVQRMLEFLESTDDEEIVGWFGNGEIKKGVGYGKKIETESVKL